jgi:hypothetical protein
MNDDNDQGDETRSRLRSGYSSPRKPKLRTAVPQKPPRLPEPYEGYESDDFGAAAEDGLLMLAALETMPSLEPEFGDDPTAEAAVTIVEQTRTRSGSPDGHPVSPRPMPRRSLTARLGDVTTQFDAEIEPDVGLLGPTEEATVEIIDVRRGASESEIAPRAGSPTPSTRNGRRLPRRS